MIYDDLNTFWVACYSMSLCIFFPTKCVDNFNFCTLWTLANTIMDVPSFR